MKTPATDVLVVGAGFAGAVMARELAEQGAHVFHTDAAMVHGWLSRFTEWLPHEDKALPAASYTAMFRHILHHRRIEVRLRTPFEDAVAQMRWRHLVWTGAIDEYFGFRFGRLPYTSLRFGWETMPTPGGGFHQPAAQIEHRVDPAGHTRSTEYRHFYGRRLAQSTIGHEHPVADGEPLFPVHGPRSARLHERYLALAAQCADVTFTGRLARFEYLRMDQVAAHSLAAAPAVAAALAGAARQAA